MQFSTTINIEKSKSSIDYHSKIFSIGSCFAVNMAQKLEYFKFKSTCNPFGILFHPIAIEKFLRNSLEGKIYLEEDVFFANERFHHFDAHSDLSNSRLQEMLKNLNFNSQKSAEDLRSSTHIIITLGTAWVYRNIETEEIIANCHKVPQKNFTKEILSVDQIFESLSSIEKLLHSHNPEAQIIFTISPVRHIKDGIVENQRSKSHLFAALHQLLDLQTSKTEYFPSYEIMMDELRDYRFYADDMLHPSNLAVEYIWESFLDRYCNQETLSVMKEVGRIQRGLAHRSFSADSEAHQKFLQGLQNKIMLFKQSYPHISF